MRKAHTGLSRREHAGKAPIPSNSSFEPTESVKTIFRNSQPAEWKPSRYVDSLYKSYFKGWGVDE